MLSAEQLEIRQAFTVEAEELLAEMESALLVLEESTGDREEFNRLFRAIHTIKGSANIVGFSPIEEFCHSVEHTLVKIRDGEFQLTRQHVAFLLKSHDHLCGLMNQFCAGNVGTPHAAAVAHSALLEELALLHISPIANELPEYGMLDSSYLMPESDNASLGSLSPEEPYETFSVNEDSAGSSVSISVEDDTSVTQAAFRDQRIVRVDAVKLDQLSDMIVELVTASSVLESNVRRLGDMSAIESASQLASLIKQVQEKSMVFRMIPVQKLFRRFQRTIHDMGTAEGKDIRLMISGGETELDKAVAEKLYDPLLHLVRNAIDHGIEPEKHRRSAGKPTTGTIHLQAYHDSGSIVIRISDDGQGINVEKVARKVADRELLKRDGISSRIETLNCIFKPGFSTLDESTILSGRGVGLDVVKNTVESLRGRVEVETEEGSGTTFQITIPLSLSLVDGFMVSLGMHDFILRMDQVFETLELPDTDEPGVMVNGCLQVRGELLPCLDLRTILAFPGSSPALRHVVVVKYGDEKIGIVVDQLKGEIKTVIKPLGRVFRDVTTVSGATILGDGSIALFLETGKLIECSVR